jgi:regulator of sigma E protease
MAADNITAIDGKNVKYWEDLQEIIHSKKNGDKVMLSLIRQGKPLQVSVKIKEEVYPDQIGEKKSVGLLGIIPFDEIVKVRHGFINSFFLSCRKTLDLTVMICKGFLRMATGKLSIKDSVAGPLGLFQIAGKVAGMGALALLNFMALLSISVGIFNLLPLPVLDGGHLILLLIEKIRKKPLSLKLDAIVTNIGLTVLVSLALFVTYNDIMRQFGDKIGKFINK